MIGPKMKALESKVNLKLLDDIISFIVKSVTVTMLQKGEIKDRCIFPCQNTSADKFQER